LELLLVGGGPDDRSDSIGRRLWTVIELGVLQRKMFRDGYAGLYHMLIFSGFVILGLRTTSLVMEGLFPAFARPLFENPAWNAYLLLKDIVLVTTFLGVTLALGRRHVVKKERLDPSLDADIILVLIAGLMVTDLMAGASKVVLSPE